MTVSYQYEVASSTSGGFTRLLFMWKGSLYKLIYRELFLFLAAFAILSALYRNAFTEEQKRLFERMVDYCDAFTSLIPLSFVLGFYVQYVAVRWWSQYLTVPWPDKLFEKVVIYCDTFINLIPLSFVLGFYVVYVAGRWWSQYLAIPWPDKIMHSIALYVSGNDEHGRMLRRTMMRYLNLSLILVLRSISSAVKRRLPTLDHLVEAGFMTKIELEMYKAVPSVEFNTYWIPCTWFINLLKETRRENRITDSQGLKMIMEEFNEFRSKCGMLWSYDWVSIPLVYTQVVTIATYSFFLAALVGRQYVEKSRRNYQMEVDIYIPVFTILQFFFYMGLLKVAEQLINPFGDDDEDFELNWIIDRHTKVSYLGVDILMSRSPPLVKDKYFDELDLILPYTEASVSYKKKTYRGSVHDMAVPEEKHTMFMPEITEEDEDKASTPKDSLQNLQVAGVGATASTTAAAAGIWRSKLPSTQNLFKYGDTKETDLTSVHYMEEGLAHPSEITVSEVSWSYTPPKEHGLKIVKPLARSESAPGRKPSLTISKWPSSSTICQSDSFRLSEISIELDGSEQGINSPKQSSAYGKPKPHSFSSADFPNQKPRTSPFSTVDSKYGSVGRRRPVLGKIRSLPKLIPLKRHNSMNSAKGVRWKTIEEFSREKYVGPHTLEFEKMYGRGSQSHALLIPSKFNSLGTPEIKFASIDFPNLKSFKNPNEAIYCDMCRRRIKRISVSPNPEAMSIVSGIKRCYSAPVLTNDQAENCNRDRSHSWQNRIIDKMKHEAKRKEMIPLNELQGSLKEVNSTFICNSAPCLSFWDNSLLCIKYPELEDNGLKFGSLVGASKEKTEVNSFPPSNSATDATPIKTFLVPNPELEMDTSSPPTSRKSSDVLNESSQDAGSWKSADWTTLLGSDLPDS